MTTSPIPDLLAAAERLVMMVIDEPSPGEVDQLRDAIYGALLAERSAGVRAVEAMREAAAKVADDYAAQMKAFSERTRSRYNDPIVAECKMGAGYDIRDAIRALPIPAPSSEWRPIETAPKDGTRFLAHTPSDVPVVLFWRAHDPADAEEAGEEGYWAFAEDLLNDVAGGSAEPTHWQPLPLPPTESSDNG